MAFRSTLVGGVGISAHLEDNIHNRRCLRDLPMNTGGSGSRGRLGKVDDEVADAPEEVVLVHVPLGAVAARDVRVRICVRGRSMSTHISANCEPRLHHLGPPRDDANCPRRDRKPLRLGSYTAGRARPHVKLQYVPMTAKPEKLASASNLGGLRASPIRTV